MKTENQKFAESFGAVQSADGSYTLSANALNHLIESARNWGRTDIISGDASWLLSSTHTNKE